MRGEANLTSPSKLICPTPTCNRVRLARCYARGIIRQPTPAYATKNRPRTGLQPSSDCSSADLRHGDLAHRYFRAIHAWRRGLMDGLRHGDPAHRCLSGILAWRRGHLSTLWHGDPQQNHFWGRVTWQDCLEPVSNRSLADASAGLRHGIPGERPLGGIMAWRSSHLLALRP